ncbi:MAG: hypothetical protein SFX72_14080 [Isosphaeraceae bacterium]|nr:hypothetical protein [Isosphaeraceae bacterium]
MVGSRLPPYMLKASGELIWRAGYSKSDTRELLVQTVEFADSPRKPPRVSSDPPLVHFAEPTVVEEGFARQPGQVVRSYRFPVSLASTLPDSAFSGRVTVSDPWNPDRVEEIILSAEANPPIRAVPSRLILAVDGPDDDWTSIRLLARSRDSLPLRAEVVEGDAGRLSVEFVGVTGEEDKFSIFEVRGPVEKLEIDRVYNIRIRTSGSNPSVLTVPVLVQAR